MILLRKLLALFNRRERIFFVVFFFANFVVAGLEAMGLGLLIPYFQFIADPASLEKYSWLKPVLAWDRGQSVVFFSAALIAIYIGKNVFLAALTLFQGRFLYGSLVRISRELLAKYFAQPYAFFLQRNSSELRMNIGRVSTIFTELIIPLMTALSETMVLGLVLLMLLKVSATITLCSVLLLGIPTLAFHRFGRAALRRVGSRRVMHADLMDRWLVQGLSGIKEAKVLGKESFFLGAFTESALVSNVEAATSATLLMLPKLLLESIAVTVIVGSLAFLALKGHDIKALIPTLGVFVVAAGRMMPSISRISSQLSLVRVSVPAVTRVIFDFEVTGGATPASLEFEQVAPMPLRQSLEIQDLTYRYEGAAVNVLERVAIQIRRGESIGLIGPSGSGKTTLVDLILGLLDPTSGKILVDGQDIFRDIRAWQRNIGYIPQTIYLTDDTIRRNIAFGVVDSEISDDQVWKALASAQLADFVKKLPDGLNTVVGERGARLSGGQRQRIGIARALYHNPELLILDEATSALDAETEREVTRAIESLTGEKTLIVIAHRMTTVQKCTRLYRIVDGKIAAQGSPEQLL